MQIVIDTREKKGQHIEEYCNANGIPIVRQKLDYGDYGIIDDTGRLSPFTVERKSGLGELAGNFMRGSYQRFQREFERADGNMALVCEESYDHIEFEHYRRWANLHPRYLIARIKKFEKMYNVPFHFVQDASAAYIVNLLKSH